MKRKTSGSPIVFCIDSPGFGGAEKMLIRLLDWIGDEDFRVVHTERLSTEVRNFLLGKKITAKEVTAVGNSAPFVGKGIARAIRIIATCPSGLFVIWGHHSDSNRWLQLVLALFRRQFILVERLVPAQRSDLDRSRLTVPLKRFVAPKAKAVVLNAYSQVEHYRGLFGLKRARMVVIPNSRPVVAINAQVGRLRAGKSELRASLGLQDRPMAVCVGRLTKQKNQAGIIRAMAELKCDAQAVFVGEGPDRAELEAIASQIAPGQIFFAGQQPDPLPWLAAADVFALPSLVEGLPGALIEAMAAELPCVASDIPGNRELVKNEETGLLVSPHSSTDLARALEKLLMNKSAADQYARAGFMLVKDRYDE
ncbi:MAG: hypothetical protein QOH39_2003, partial [Verrucomicrobiota bacterium]